MKTTARPSIHLFCEQVAEELGLEPSTARKWMASGKLGEPFKIGKRSAILREDLERWIRRQAGKGE